VIRAKKNFNSLQCKGDMSQNSKTEKWLCGDIIMRWIPDWPL